MLLKYYQQEMHIIRNIHLVPLLSPRQMARIKSKQGIKLNGEIKGINQNEDEKWKREGKEVTHAYEKSYHVMQEHTKKENTEIYSYCRAVRLGTVYMPCRIHGKATATTTAVAEREEKCAVVLLSFVWFPLDNTLFIAPNIQY